MCSSPIWPPTEANLRQAAALVREGELIVIPTDTVYGVACMLSKAALQRLFRAKGRPENRPIPVLISSPRALPELVAEWPPEAQALSAAFWPGPLTIVVPALKSLPEELTAGTGTIGVRQPRHPTATRLLALAGGYLAVTSANRSNEPPALTAQEAFRALGGSVAVIIDDGPAELGVPSTVVSVVGRQVRILRLGAISQAELKRAIEGARHLCPNWQQEL